MSMLKCRVCGEHYPKDSYRLTPTGNQSSRCEACWARKVDWGARPQCRRGTRKPKTPGKPVSQMTPEELRAKRSRDRRRSYRRSEFTGSFEEWAARHCPARKFRGWMKPIVRVKGWDRWPGMVTPHAAERSAIKYRWRYKHEPEFRLAEILRCQARKHRRFGCLNTRLRQSLFYPSRNADVFEMLGYTPQDLRIHLERQFKKDMCWDRFAAGEIHIDHVRPLKVFDLEDPEQVKEAWSLTNLQPLWAEDNQRKAAHAHFLL